jgi:hypothetical protein
MAASKSVKQCKDCVTEGIRSQRPAPYPGPRCHSHHRAEQRRRKEAAHDKMVQRVYGLEPGQYAEILAAQGGKCAICQRATGRSKRMAVDHCHATGEVRGILDSVCNRLLGVARDNPEFFRRAADYLEDPPARRVLRDR